MQSSRYISLTSRLLVGLTITLIACSLAANAAVNGAIQTTDSTGTIVNFNVNPPLSCDAVYLTGGPQNTNDAGLSPAGTPGTTYYFQVTDPSGKVLLSTDTTTDRQLTVSTYTTGKGVISSALPGTHLQGSTDANSGETTVRLWPFTTTPNNGGVYKAWISTDSTFTNSTTKTDNFKCVPPPPPPDCSDPDYAAAHPDECGTPPPPSATIVGTKFYDANTDGTQDNGELGIQGWLVTIDPTAQGGTSCNLTDSSGNYLYSVDPNSGDYALTEGDALQSAWKHTTAASGIATAGTGTIQGPNFGNVCVGAGGGLTLGYWSNKNGQASMGCKTTSVKCTSELAFLTGLNLRNANGTNFDPTTYSQFSTWLLSATATNMAYMLSAQLSAMELNVLNHTTSPKFGVDGNSLVFVGTPPAGCNLTPNAAGFVSVNALMADANTLLGADGLTLSGNPDRTCQEFDKTALDNANNNLTFVQSDQNSCPAFTFDPNVLNACTF